MGKMDTSPAPRQVSLRYSNGVTLGSKNITAGQFIQPVFNYVFPELIAFGGKQPPIQFKLLPYLLKGSGPFVPGNLLSSALATAPIVGQLSPWPGAPIAAAPKCPAPVTTTPAATPVTTTRTTTTTSTSTAAIPTDTIKIISAAARNQKGVTSTTISATTTSKTAKLFMAIFGVDNVAATASSLS
ncbi:hypothetical protein B0H17DRAFT_190854 [Mycena rosella]|uniref:Uncharacterized protein n=1 Tax=Mycena rosella TaxID=1033263 RepID=A0AAD7CZQ6_MYCRO|nr:hypothetical protein B0H17DRAFT_190854 [Mycena rosella]